MKFPFYIAKRYLVSKKSHNAINIISWISVISVAIGTFALVVVLSAFNGLESLVESLYETFDSDIRIEVKEGKTFNEEAIDFEAIKNMKGVANYSKVLEEICGIRFQQQQAVATIKGVENSFLEMSQLDSMMIDGEAVLLRNGIPYAITGYGIAASLGIYGNQSAENISIYAPKRGKIKGGVDPMQNVYSRMIASAGVFYISPDYDNKYVVVPLSFARDLLKYDKEISAIEVTATKKTDLNKLKADFELLMGDDFKVSNRYEFNELMYKTNKTEKWVVFLILLFILIIAAFNILSSLSMLIIEKRKDIGILKSMGARYSSIRKIFFIEGILINLSGALTGITLGVILVLMQQYIGILPLEGGIVDYYPVKLKVSELFYILLTVITIGLLTSWYPVRNLTKVEN